MKKKVFFILSSLTAGGSERVYWLLSQGLDKSLYDVYLVILDSSRSFFSSDLKDVKVIDLKTAKASRSFFKLYRLLKKEKPYAVYTTGGQINALVGFTSFFVDIPVLIARPSNVAEKAKFAGNKSKFLSLFTNIFYKRFSKIVCQSEEIKAGIVNKYGQLSQKMVVIPNPVVPTEIIKNGLESRREKKLIVVARLAKQKGHERLLEIFKELPSNYSLTIVGDGPLKQEIIDKVASLQLQGRVKVLGLVQGVPSLIAEHDLMVLPSFIEGFPNVVVEALSVGIPVISFKVGGISQLIKNDFNGYILEQNDSEGFKNSIIKAANKSWDASAIKNRVLEQFSIDKVVQYYERLIA